MNEIDSYDPNTFSINMTRSVYIKLEGKFDIKNCQYFVNRTELELQ